MDIPFKVDKRISENGQLVKGRREEQETNKKSFSNFMSSFLHTVCNSACNLHLSPLMSKD